jgi:hypothetical protein
MARQNKLGRQVIRGTHSQHSSPGGCYLRNARGTLHWPERPTATGIAPAKSQKPPPSQLLPPEKLNQGAQTARSQRDKMCGQATENTGSLGDRTSLVCLRSC